MNEEVDFKTKMTGYTAEIGGGIATDFATSGLLTLGPWGAVGYGIVNFGQGAYTNYLVQKHLYGKENVKWGEVWASGGMSAIPFMNIGVSKGTAKVLGQANTVKRGIVGGVGMGLASEQTRVGIDENRLLSFEEMALASGVGGVFGGGFTAASKGFQKVQRKRAYKKYYGNYSSPAEAAKAKYSSYSDIRNQLVGAVEDDWELPEIAADTQERITSWQAYARAGADTVGSAEWRDRNMINGYMRTMQMPTNDAGEYIFDFNQYLRAADQGLIAKNTEDRLFAALFMSAGSARSGRTAGGRRIGYPTAADKREFVTRFRTLFDALGIPDSHFQPHHLLPLKASLPLYHGLAYGSEEWWQLTAHLLQRSIQAGDSMANLKMFVGAGRPTTPRQTRVPPAGQRTTNPVPNQPTVKTPHSIQHQYLRDPDYGIGEAGEYYFTPDVLTTLWNEPNRRPEIAHKFINKLRRGFTLTNDAEKIFNGLYDMKNYDQSQLKLNLEDLVKVLNKMDNDGYLPDYHNIKKDLQVDLLSKVIKQVEKDGTDDPWRHMIDAHRRIQDLHEEAVAVSEHRILKAKRLRENRDIDAHEEYFKKVLKRDAEKFSMVSDLDDAEYMAERLLLPHFLDKSGKLIEYEGLDYETAVKMLGNLIYENL